MLAAWDVNRTPDCAFGVAVISYRLNIAAGDHFASIEDLYVTPEARRKGVGRKLLDAVEKECSAKNISYVEVQVVEEETRGFYVTAGFECEEGVAVLSRSYALGGSNSETS